MAGVADSNFGGHHHAPAQGPREAEQAFIRSQLFAAVRMLDAGQLSEEGFRRALGRMGVVDVPAEVARLLRSHASGGTVPFRYDIPPFAFVPDRFF